jgi:hypothetical protein
VAESLSELLGARVLVGLTVLEHDGSLLEREQFCGVVEIASAEGVLLRLPNGDTRSLPPAPEAFHKAEAGEYRLRSTGEVVVDPDWLRTWTLRRPPPDHPSRRH